MKGKIIFALILAAVMLFGMISCSKDENEPAETQSEATSTSDQSPTEETSMAEETTTEETTSEETTSEESSSEEKSVTVEYAVQDGATLIGEGVQSVILGESTKTVSVEVKDGYKFLGWDDGNEATDRSDVATEDKVYTAKIVKVHKIEIVYDTRVGKVSGRLTQEIEDGKSTSVFFASANLGYTFVGWSTGETDKKLQITPTEDMRIEAIFERDDDVFPVVTIHTKGGAGIVSKDQYIDCTIGIGNTSEEYSLERAEGKIRGRGNSTWDYPKKPFKIKFDEATDLFGNGEAREWTLIANYIDLSLVRNYLALTVASKFDAIDWTSSATFVDVYLNGEYLGVYMLCEQIEVAENKINIDTSYENIDTGYLIERDGRADGNAFFVGGESYVLKTPDSDDVDSYKAAHKEFIQSYMQSCLDALQGDDYSKVEELMDTESFAQAYIVFEVFKCVDVGYASFFMHKDAGGKLTCGPVWDFDRCMGVIGNSTGAQLDNLWAKSENIWFRNLLNHEEFVELVASTLEEYAPIMNETLDQCYAYISENESGFRRNFVRWKLIGTNVWPNPSHIWRLSTWQAQVEYTKTYFEDSLAFLFENYPTEQEIVQETE
ncbi:MAG: CotH kinase family protein [Clostridia bacterium]|nr:CotH kinase family protein [Clostridia bacterium]